MRKFGLIGYPLSHSFSKGYFTDKFIREGIQDSIYENFSIPSIEHLEDVLLQNPDLIGLNVTIPYKQQVIRYLHDLSHLPLDACNCIRIDKGRLIGFNTDIAGFEKSWKPLWKPHQKKSLVLGSGGAALAVNFVLEKNGVGHTTVARRRSDPSVLLYSELNEQIIREHLIIVNTTPVGMFPNSNECPDIPYEWLSSDHYLFDLIYNPAKTLFLQKGQDRGATIHNGADMLVIQAEESWRIWNDPGA